MTWLFVWDRSYNNTIYIAAASFVLFLLAITNILAVAILARNISVNSDYFTDGSPLFMWGVWYRLVLNSWGLYTTWTVIANLLNLTTALVYVGKVRIMGL